MEKIKTRKLSYAQYKFQKIQLQQYKNSAGDLGKIEKSPKKEDEQKFEKKERWGKLKNQKFILYTIYLLEISPETYIFLG